MHGVFDERRYLIPFRATLLPQIFTDVLVIGAGVAGLRGALAAAGYADVIVVCKGKVNQSNTDLAQGGIAAVMGGSGRALPGDPGSDSLALHRADSLKAGARLCDESIVREVVAAGSEEIEQLIKWSMRIDRVSPGGNRDSVALGREGGHSHSRILHSDGDATGKELGRTLYRQVKQRERVRVFDQCYVLDLITVPGGGVGGLSSEDRCIGAITHHEKYGLQVIWAGATILAGGGCGQVYRESTNAGVATGDGLAMAYRAGAKLADMAFMQFHPTTLYVAGAARSLISEAVRGEGAYLIDHNGQRFMPNYDERGELAPRDIVSLAILEQTAKTHYSHVFLDCRHMAKGYFGKRFPGIMKMLKRFDIDPGRELIPVHPSAHYMIGGVRTDGQGRTNVSGLYACGESASTGLHGANRLASNSLLEGLVMGRRAGVACQEMLDVGGDHAVSGGAMPAKIVSDIPLSDRSELDVADVRSSLRSVMWRHVGIKRRGDRLCEVAEMFDFWARYTLDKIFDDREGWQVQNMLLVGALITQAANWRQESRGTHYREDHPKPDEPYRVHDIWQRGVPEPTLLPVQQEAKEPLAAG